MGFCMVLIHCYYGCDDLTMHRGGTAVRFAGIWEYFNVIIYHVLHRYVNTLSIYVKDDYKTHNDYKTHKEQCVYNILYVYICVCLYIYVCIYIYIYIYIHTHTHTHTHTYIYGQFHGKWTNSGHFLQKNILHRSLRYYLSV